MAFWTWHSQETRQSRYLRIAASEDNSCAIQQGWSTYCLASPLPSTVPTPDCPDILRAQASAEASFTCREVITSDNPLLTGGQSASLHEKNDSFACKEIVTANNALLVRRTKRKPPQRKLCFYLQGNSHSAELDVPMVTIPTNQQAKKDAWRSHVCP